MKILVTGCNGFVGSSFGRVASSAGHQVLGVARTSTTLSGWPGTYAQVDLLHSGLCDLVSDFGPDLVFHAAGAASVIGSLEDPLKDFRATVLTLNTLLEAIHRSGRRPTIIYPSSAAVYGNIAELPVHEDSPLHPISPYGFHKVVCELLGREYAECFGQDFIVCRLFSLFGPVQRRLLVWELYRQFRSDQETIYLEGTGAETRDYLHVDDAATAILQLSQSTKRRKNNGFLVVNVASGKETNVMELARQIGCLVGSEKEVCCRGIERKGDPAAWRADTSRLHSLIPGWSSKPLEAGLAHCLTEWRSADAI